MTWLRLDDRFYRRPDVLALSLPARWLHLSGMSLCMEYGTDRHVARHMALTLPEAHHPEALAELEAAGLWIADGAGWAIADPVMQEQPSAAEIEAQRAYSKARMAITRAKRDGASPETIEALRLAADACRRDVTEARDNRSTPVAVQRPMQRTLPRPVPSRPGEATPLSGEGTVSAGPVAVQQAAQQAVQPAPPPPDDAPLSEKLGRNGLDTSLQEQWSTPRPLAAAGRR